MHSPAEQQNKSAMRQHRHELVSVGRAGSHHRPVRHDPQQYEPTASGARRSPASTTPDRSTSRSPVHDRSTAIAPTPYESPECSHRHTAAPALPLEPNTSAPTPSVRRGETRPRRVPPHRQPPPDHPSARNPATRLPSQQHCSVTAPRPIALPHPHAALQRPSPIHEDAQRATRHRIAAAVCKHITSAAN